VLIVADKQILCASCGKLVGVMVRRDIVVKDQFVIVLPAERVFYCNPICKERAQV
jgi:hypothetical protein